MLLLLTDRRIGVMDHKSKEEPSDGILGLRDSILNAYSNFVFCPENESSSEFVRSHSCFNFNGNTDFVDKCKANSEASLVKEAD